MGFIFMSPPSSIRIWSVMKSVLRLAFPTLTLYRISIPNLSFSTFLSSLVKSTSLTQAYMTFDDEFYFTIGFGNAFLNYYGLWA
jgi:hypothetical protein